MKYGFFTPLSTHFTLALTLLLGCHTSVAATILYLDSESGDYIGQGITQTITDADATFTASSNYDNGVSVSINSSTTWWNTNFAAPFEAELLPSTYIEAARFSFQSITQAGLSVTGDGRGCNTLTGHFTVYEIQYGPSDTITTFAANFTQYCDGNTAALNGAIRINSDLPAIVPTPTAAAGYDQNIREGDAVMLNGSYSNGGDVAIASYQWQQLSGPSVTLSDTSSSTPSFTAPSVSLGGETVTLQLTVININGETDVDTISINIASKSDPVTYLSMQSEAGDYIGQGLNYDYDINDGLFDLSDIIDGISIYFNGQEYWYLYFTAPSGTPFEPGPYEGATRHPFQASTEPGLSVSGEGRGCNTLTGRFDLLHVGRDSLNAVDELAIDFEQHCESDTAALFGQLRINYTLPGVPTASAGPDQAITSGTLVQLDASSSTDSDGSIQSYTWSQTSGKPVSLSSTSSVQPDFTAPTLSDGTTENLIFRVLVTDDAGYMGEDFVTITVTGTGSSDTTSDPAITNTGSGGGGVLSLPLLLLLFVSSAFTYYRKAAR